MFFRTAHDDHFTGKMADPESIGENMRELYTIGNRNNKYLSHTGNKEKLADWGAVSYRKDYYAKEALDLEYNYQVAQDAKIRKPKPSPDVEGCGARTLTNNLESYPKRTLAEYKGAKLPPAEAAKPSPDPVVGGKWLGEKSYSHHTLNDKSKLFKSLRSAVIMPTDSIHIEPMPFDFWETRYNVDYSSDRTHRVMRKTMRACDKDKERSSRSTASVNRPATGCSRANSAPKLVGSFF